MVVKTVSKVSVSVEKESFAEGLVVMISFLQEERRMPATRGMRLARDNLRNISQRTENKVV